MKGLNVNENERLDIKKAAKANDSQEENERWKISPETKKNNVENEKDNGIRDAKSLSGK